MTIAVLCTTLALRHNVSDTLFALLCGAKECSANGVQMKGTSLPGGTFYSNEVTVHMRRVPLHSLRSGCSLFLKYCSKTPVHPSSISKEGMQEIASMAVSEESFQSCLYMSSKSFELKPIKASSRSQITCRLTQYSRSISIKMRPLPPH